MKPKTRYQRGTIRIRGGKVYGEWRGEPGPDGKRLHKSVLLGRVKPGKSRNAWRDELRVHIERDYLSGERGPITGGMTLSEFIERVYVPAHEGNWTRNSRKAIHGVLHHIEPLGARPLSSILKADIVQRLTEIRAAGYSKRTIVFTKWLLGSIFEEAIDNDLIGRTPVRRISMRNIPDGEQTRPLTEDEARRIYATTTGVVRLCWRLLIGCGLRPGEVAALRRNDVMDAGLRVDETYERGQFGPTKTRQTRMVPLPESLRAELSAHIAALQDQKPGAVLFLSDTGAVMSNQCMGRLIQAPARVSAGIPDLKMRQGRATFATLLEGDLADLRAVLGHKADSPVTLRHYKQAIPERQRQAAEELDRRLNQGPKLKVIRGGNR